MRDSTICTCATCGQDLITYRRNGKIQYTEIARRILDSRFGDHDRPVCADCSAELRVQGVEDLATWFGGAK